MLIIILIVLCFVAVTNTTALITIIYLRHFIREDLGSFQDMMKQRINAFLEVFRKAKNHESK